MRLAPQAALADLTQIHQLWADHVRFPDRSIFQSILTVVFVVFLDLQALGRQTILCG
jgi:hypothetical protein